MSKQKSCRASHGRAENNGRWGLGLALVAVAVLAACGGGGGGGDTPQPQQPAQFTVTCPDGSSQTAATEAAAKDKCAPARILSISPGNGESVSVSTFTGITFTMDGLLDPASTVSSSAKVSAPDGSTVPATVTPSADGKAFTVSWSAKPVIYTLVVTIKDSAGHGVQLTTTVGIAPASAHYVWVVVRSGVGEGLSYLDFASGKELPFTNKTGKVVFGFEEAAPHTMPDGHLLMRPNVAGEAVKQVMVDVDLDARAYSLYQGAAPASVTWQWYVQASDPAYDVKTTADGKTCYAASANVPRDKQDDVVCTGMTFPGAGRGNVVNIIAVKVGG